MALEETHATEQSTAITDDVMDGIVVLEEDNDTSIGSHGTGGTPGSLLTTADFSDFKPNQHSSTIALKFCSSAAGEDVALEEARATQQSTPITDEVMHGVVPPHLVVEDAM